MWLMCLNECSSMFFQIFQVSLHVVPCCICISQSTWFHFSLHIFCLVQPIFHNLFFLWIWATFFVSSPELRSTEDSSLFWKLLVDNGLIRQITEQVDNRPWVVELQDWKKVHRPDEQKDQQKQRFTFKTLGWNKAEHDKNRKDPHLGNLNHV